MSLKPFSACVVPERTASVARAAFPKGNLCIRIFDELGTIFQDQDFADLYSQHGQPGQQPFRLALAPVLQFIEGLSDRGAADAVRGRIDWKYLLCLELIDGLFPQLKLRLPFDLKASITTWPAVYLQISWPTFSHILPSSFNDHAAPIKRERETIACGSTVRPATAGCSR